ncbi:DUF4350 domain-containing protein [Allopontixanthobacter sediminis]|uniref:DUF4350 domain-containing protein n=1 Tax=Allopontixanthobacter sediminis TaxID=1689985 RepID=A0A845B3F7_9SPHN|nr:DUF4350 domain-containing protein [Allopontixanthobacter sediminis]MXP44112.1 DUF4350 domain-containing protein [Allopontixanthobacter sediminis]
MTTRAAGPFNPKVMLALVLFGALAFFATLYFIGTGQTGGGNDGGGHAAGRGLNGYAALAELLEDDGYDVSLSRSPGALTGESLLILTPPAFMEAEDLAEVIENRRLAGPTLVILPKWNVSEIPDQWDVEKEKGWVLLSGASEPFWLQELEGDLAMEGAVTELEPTGPHWRGLGMSGNLPDPVRSLSISGDRITPVVRDSDGETLIGYLDDGGYYPDLADAASIAATERDDEDAYEKWGVVFVAETDLLNNYGMADAQRAELAREIVALSMESYDLPVTFDLTQSGLGGTENLLTLAMKPPFLAATLCLLIAMLVVGWRAFRRFGPPASEGRAIAFGKRQLVANSAGLIQRTRRMHLLSAPYADMMRSRIAAALGLHRADDSQIDAALHRRLPDEPSFGQTLDHLRKARTPHEVLRAANALRSLERKLSR